MGITIANFYRTLSRAAKFASVDQSRDSLRGVLVEYSTYDQELRIVATNGHRLFRETWSDIDHHQDLQVVVTPEYIKNLEPMKKSGYMVDLCKLSEIIEDSHIFKTPYPQYDRGIPREFSTELAFNGPHFQHLVAVLEKTHHCASRKTEMVRVQFPNRDRLSITVRDLEYDVNATCGEFLVPYIRYSGNFSQVGFNGVYLLQALKEVWEFAGWHRGELKKKNPFEIFTMQWGFNTAVSATVMTAKKACGSITVLLMPLRIFE